MAGDAMNEMEAVPLPLVAGRECGSCNACCVHLTIDEPELRKAQGIRCHNALADNSCAIYASRPKTCRLYFCGWKILKWIKEPMRPDRSGVLVRLRSDGTGRPTAVVFTLLTEAAVHAEGLAESVAAAVQAGVPVYLSVPGPPGHTSAIGRINAVLEDAVAARDKAAMLRILAEARAEGAQGTFRPVVLRHADGTGIAPSSAARL
jgi:hypothetical protein